MYTWGGSHFEDTVRHGYLINEQSPAAPLGSSLGWTVQLDADDLRNALLNSPWVKVVLPIRPGREVEAFNWLRSAHAEGTDGLNATYSGDTGSTVGEALLTLAEQLRTDNTDIRNYLATEKVFETGFDPLAGGFQFDPPAFSVCSEWHDIIPTEEVVAVDYTQSQT